MAEPKDSRGTTLTRRKRRGLIVISIIVIALALVIFVGYNLAYMKQAKHGEPVGNSTNVAGPDNR